MKLKTFILTFLMMMSSPFLFGQHWVDPDYGTDNTMPISATITLDDVWQTEAYQVAAFHGETLLDVVSIIEFEIPNSGDILYHVDMEIPYVDGKTDDIYFRLFNGTNEFVSSTKIDWNENGYLHTNPLEINFKSVAQIEGTEYDVVYSSLQDAIDAAANEDVITLLQNNAENVTVVQAPDVAFTINGAEKTMTGTITVNGKSAAYPTAGLTIKNVYFDATNIADASIMLGVSGNTNTRYTNGVTVQDCNFTGNGQTKAAIKNYTGGCKNITVTGGTFTGLHSLMQVKGVDGVEVSGVTVENCKNGIAVGTSTNVAISGSTISATGYGVRADGEGAYNMTLTDNTISAELPVVVRYATGNYELNIGENNSFTAKQQGNNPEGYQVVFTNGDDGTYEAPTGIFSLTVAEGTNLNVYPVYVAKIGDRGYMTIEAAIDAAQAGETVIILPGTYNQSITIDKAGIAVRGEYPVYLENAGLIITADGVTVSDIQVYNPGGKAVQINAKDILIEYCDLAGANGLYQSYTSGTVTFSNSYIGGGTYGIHFDGNAGGNIVIEDCTIAGWTSFASSIDHVTITNTTFEGANYNQLRFYQDATVENVTFPAGMRVDTGSGGTGMEDVTLTFNDCEVADGGNLEDVFPGSVIVKSNIYVDGELLVRVAQIEDEYYKTLQDAIDAATEGQTITLIDNITIATNHTDAAKGYFQIEEDDKIVIDLNGKNITVTESATGNFLLFSNYGELTLIDSQSSAVVELTATNNRAWNAQSTIVLNRGGVLNINGGKYVHKGGTDMAITICNSANSFGPAYLYVNGGEIISETYIGVRMRMENPAANGNPGNDISYMYVTDGYIYGLNRGIWGHKSTGANEKQGELVITGGTIENATADRGAIQFDTDSYEAQNVVATISGDAFIKGQVIAGKDEMSITGGTFTTDVTEYCAFGYTCQANGDGTYGVVETEGFEIPNLDRLIAFRNAVNAGNTFKNQTVTVTADIDLSSVENWAPIGTEATPFQGTFDGGNFTISNLKINAPETSNVGLFGCIKNGATIQNLTIDNATVNAKSNVGAIVGNLHSSTMDNCHVTGLVQINGNYKVGGLVGTAYSSVRNSSLVADDYSYVKGTHATANLEGDNVGGITGYNGEGVYTYSNNTVKNVTISGTRKVGGILGFIFEDAKVEGSVVENVTIESTATNEYAQENAGKMSIGGIIGQYQTHGSNNGYVNSSVVKNVTFVKGEELDFQVGPLVGGTRNNANFVPSATVTSKDNHVYMTTITGSNNLFLMHAVAKIEEANYYTLEEAIAAANNQTVTVLEDVELRNSLTINVDQTVTLDLNGKTITGTPTEAAEYVLVTNIGILTITDDSETKEGKLVCNHTLAGSTAYAVNTISNRSGGVLTIEAGTIENTSTASNQIGYAIDNYSGSAVIIKGGKVTASGSGYYDGIRQFCNSETLENSVTIEGGEVSTLWIQNPSNNNERAVIGSFEITGGTLNNLFLEPSYNFSGSITGGYVGNISRFESNENDIVNFITGGTFGQDPTAYVAPGYVVKYNETTSRYEVFLGVAKIEETGAIYGTLAQAIGAAQQGNTIILLANVTEDVTVNKSLTINGDSKEYTGVMAGNVGLTITVNNVKFVNGRFAKDSKSSTGNYTFNSCTFTGNSTLPYALRFAGANTVIVQDCTVENYQFSFLYVSSGTNTVNVKDVIVENCPSYAIYFASGVNYNMIENLTVKNSNNGIIYNNTANRTLNLKGCTFEDVENVINHANGTLNITSNFYGENNIGNKALSQYAKPVLAEADATLVNAPAGLTVTTTVEGCVVEYEEGETEGFGTYSVVAANVALYRGEDLVKKFATIQAAIDAAVDGDVVKVLKDLTVDVNNENISTFPAPIDYPNIHACFVVAGKTITIDFAGCDITANVTATSQFFGLFFAGNNGHLTLTDSSEEVGTVEMIVSDNAKVYALITNIDVTSSITVKNGNYSCNQIVGWGQSLIYDAQGKMLVEGGNYYLGNIGTGNNGLPWIFNTYQQNERSTTVTGGTFNADVNHQYWAHEVYVPETLALKNNGNGTWTVVESEAYITEISSGYTREVGYATLAEAFEATIIRNTEDNTVTVVKNITLAESITVNADQEVVLDLNGKVVSYESATVGEDMITNKGKLTIESNVEGGKLTYNNTDVTSSNVTISTISTEPGSELIINSGIVENTSIGNSSQVLVPYTIDILTNGNLGDVAVTINGGSIISTNYIAIRQFVNGNVCNNSLIVKDGTIQALKRAINVQDAQGAGEVKNCAKLLVEGGNIIADDENGYSIRNLANSENISVTGGNFVGQVYSAIDGIITGGTFNMEPYFAYCAEGYAAVDNGDGTWTVMPTQEQHLVAGWNWYSSYLNITSDDLTTALGSNATQIKGQTQSDGFMNYVEAWNVWTGTLNLDFAKMYMINTNQACDIQLAADVLNPQDYTVKLHDGWNWIGYPSNEGVSVIDAFANLTPQEGDIIKTRNSGHAEYAWGMWIGTLRTMIPGKGYMYRNTSGEEKQFVYNIGATTRGSLEANYTTENNHWTPDSGKYPFNMTMTAVVDGMTNGNYEVAAFVNGEVRGSARPIYVEPMDAYILFLTIHGDDVEEMSFKLYDIDTDTEYDLEDRMNYSSNAVVGSVSDPYVFSRGTMGIGENAFDNFNIYPNPTTIGTEINLNATCDKVEVFNVLGVKIIEYHNVDSIDAFETAGIYVIRVTNNGSVKHCRLVVK